MFTCAIAVQVPHPFVRFPPAPQARSVARALGFPVLPLSAARNDVAFFSLSERWPPGIVVLESTHALSAKVAWPVGRLLPRIVRCRRSSASAHRRIASLCPTRRATRKGWRLDSWRLEKANPSSQELRASFLMRPRLPGGVPRRVPNLRRNFSPRRAGCQCLGPTAPPGYFASHARRSSTTVASLTPLRPSAVFCPRAVRASWEST